MLKKEKIRIGKYECIRVSNEYYFADIMTKLGGKIIGFGLLKNEGNEVYDFFYKFSKLDYADINLHEIEDIAKYRETFKYAPIGGYKTWLAPQDIWGWPPYMDLELGEYSINFVEEEERIKIELKSPLCRETEMIIERTIIVENNSKELEIKERIINKSKEIKEYGIWEISQIKKNGITIIPLGEEKKIISLNEKDWSRFVEYLYIEGKYFAVVKSAEKIEYKIGVAFNQGWVLTIKEDGENRIGYLKTFMKFSEGTKYGHGCAVEYYNSHLFDYYEVEVHSPMVKLDLEQSYSFEEKWEILNWGKNDTLEMIIKDVDNKTRK